MLVVQRWRRYGNDRLYVKTEDGRPVGYVDLRTGTRRLDRPELADQLEAAVADFAAELGIDTGAATSGADAQMPPVVPPAPISPAVSPLSPSPVVTEPDALPAFTPAADPPYPAAPPPVLDSPPLRRPPQPRAPRGAVPMADGPILGDLADNKPGHGVQQQAELLAARHPISSPLARLFGLRGADWAWRRGAAGERKVGRRLNRLARFGRWKVLHSVPLGRAGADVDHLLIGPSGVWAVNTKTHKGKHLRAGRTVVFVGRSPTDYAEKSRREAQRVSTALSAALGRHVPVSALIVCTGQASLRGWLRHAPLGVQVLPLRWSGLWLRVRGRAALSPHEVEQLYAVARRPATYRGV